MLTSRHLEELRSYARRFKSNVSIFAARWGRKNGKRVVILDALFRGQLNNHKSKPKVQ